jgi:hypothetical protein
MNTLRITSLAIAGLLAASGTAGATTVTFAINLPFQINNAPAGAFANASVTCSVGGTNLAYRSGSASADHEWGHGTLPLAGIVAVPHVTVTFAADVPTKLVPPGSPLTAVFPATNYVCWLVPPATKPASMPAAQNYPVTFVQGTVSYAALQGAAPNAFFAVPAAAPPSSPSSSGAPPSGGQ